MANTKITNHIVDATIISAQTAVTAASGDYVLIQDVSDSNALKKVLVSDLAQNEENPTFTGVVTANAGVVVDNITIDGTEIDLSSGDLTIDVAGDIILDANGDNVTFAKNTTQCATIDMGSNNFDMKSLVSNADIIFRGNDGGVAITALTLDMSEAGAATFNSSVTASALSLASGGVLTQTVVSGGGDYHAITHTGNESWTWGARSGSGSDDYLDVGISGGTRTMSWHEDGKVGIGNTSPGHTLAVKGAANGTTLCEFTGTDGRGLRLFTQKSNYPTDSGQNDAVVVYNAQDTESAAYPGHVFQYAGNEVLRLQQVESSGATGAVGINEAAPAYTLDVNSSGESNAMRLYQGTNAKDLTFAMQNQGTGSGDDALLTITTAAGAGDPYVRFNISGTDSWAMGINNSENDEFQIANQSTLGGTSYMKMVGGDIHFSSDDSDCKLYLGSTGSDFGGNSTHNIRCSGNNFMFNSGNSNFIFEINGSQKGYIDANGFNNGSDRNLKKDIEDITYGLDTVKLLQPRKFKWKADDSNSIGLIAQEVETHIPEIVSESAPDNDEITSIKGVNYQALTSVLIKGMQEQQTIIDDLKSRIETLEG